MLTFYLSMIDSDSDKSKFEQLYIKYRNPMLNRAYDILGDRGLAEDAVHNAFLSILKNLDKIDDVCSNRSRAYVLIIAENMAKNMYKKEKRMYEADLSELPSDFSLDDYIDNKEAVRAVRERIAALPEIYSSVMTLKYVYDMTDKQIASSLSLKLYTVQKRLARGKKLLLGSQEVSSLG